MMITMKTAFCLMAVGLIATLSIPAEAKLAGNRLAANRLAANRLAANRLAANGIATAGAGAVSDVFSVTLQDRTVLSR
jgi:hypothetical protein